jgi:hypothetical protein
MSHRRAVSLLAVRKVVSLLMFGGLLVGTLFGQRAEPAKQSHRDDLDNPLASAMERLRETDNPLARQQWFMHGRTVEHGNASEYLYRAYQQKMTQRAMRRMQTQATGTLSPNSLAPRALPSATWTNLGPAPLNSDWIGNGFQDYGTVGGRVTAVAVDQNDSTGNTAYIGSAYGGVWKTTNGAATPNNVHWAPIMDTQATLAVDSIAVQPGNSNVILVGTGEPNSAVDSYYGLGMLRSSDGGVTWSLNSAVSGTSGALKGWGIKKIVFSPDTAGLVVAAVSSSTLASGLGFPTLSQGLGIIYSTDAGVSWQNANVTDGGVKIASVSATDIQYNAAAHKWFAAVRYHGVYSSTDGVNWSRLAAQPIAGLSSVNCPTASNSTSCPMFRGEMASHPTKNEIYIWFIDSSSAQKGIFQSTDGGSTWNTISTGDLDNCNVAGTSGDACGVYQAFYNMYLSAVPNGSATDLYAGSGNIFKCQISAANPDCSKNAAGSNWLLLSHAYSCSPASAPAHVHPDQHGIDFSRNNPSIIYFGNDGGIYRTLNGPGLNSSSCAATLPFDNLNANLGSTLQFYSLAGSPSDPTAFIGGTQDNGTPGIDSSHAGANGVTWSEINGGDGGAVAIDPTNPNNWYMETTVIGANIALFNATSGAGSRAPGHGSPYLTSSQLGGDAGDWVTPFKLDPADSTKIVIGTCRIWRGPANTATGWTAANAISSIFGTAASCTSSSNGMTRTIAVGGPKTVNGSQAIYAGTEYGHVFATNNADAGPSSWTDVLVSNVGTCSGYPCGYPVSGIAIDPRDSTGKTAYATVMGFGVGHVFKTTDGGHSWLNISGNLVDAPANAVAVDPGNPSILYVGNDVGVFASTDGGSTWAEYGDGLPNSAVFAIDTFNNSSTHLLRVATHGRGVWSTTLASAVTATVTVTTSPSFLTFLNQAVGSVSATQTVTVSVSGAAVTVGQASATAGFQLKSDTCSNTTVQAGGTCTFGVAFAPTAAGVQNGTVTASLTGAGLVGTGTINLEGNGVVASGANVTPETGWWWDPKLSGTGFFLEYRAASVQNPTPGIFVGGFLYDALGNSTWLITLGSVGGSFSSNTSGLTYSGNWIRCSGGQSLTGTSKQNSCNTNYAPVTIVFPDSQHATMTRPDGTKISLVRFSFNATPSPIPPEPGTAQNGWWWIDPVSPTYNAGSGGTGYGIEFQGNSVFIVAYVYDPNTGLPIWDLATSGSTPITSATNFTQTWNGYQGGPQLTSPEGSYSAGPVPGTSVPVTFNFTDTTHGTMTMGTTVIPIQKFTLF